MRGTSATEIVLYEWVTILPFGGPCARIGLPPGKARSLPKSPKCLAVEHFRIQRKCRENSGIAAMMVIFRKFFGS